MVVARCIAVEFDSDTVLEGELGRGVANNRLALGAVEGQSRSLREDRIVGIVRT